MSAMRASGVLIPLPSIPSRQSWGIGEYLDLPSFAAWLSRGGQGFVQLLPINEMPPGERSPYSSMTAMALDPIFIAVPRVPDFGALGGEAALDAHDRTSLARVRGSSQLEYRAVRELKDRWLRRAHERFLEMEVARGSPRAFRYTAFLRDEAWWLDDYAAFRALFARFRHHAWWEWPDALADRAPRALREAISALEGEIDYWKYVQWVASEQWAEARRLARPVRVFGDLPFMVSANSPDVWGRQAEFRRDATVGVPPDAFSETGQDWGLPPWRWDVMAQNNFGWIRSRARRSAAIYDGFRLDHLVGLYRTYMRPIDPITRPFFAPPDEGTQTRLGEKIVSIYQASGAEITAEDLGTVPDFVRHSLGRLGVPGYRVMRWERKWHLPGRPFIDPAEYPENSVATPGTHDSETLAEWWTELPAGDRGAVLRLKSVAQGLAATEDVSSRTGSGEEPASAFTAPSAFTPAVRDALLQVLLSSGSRLVILPVQDVFGWVDRINTPATVDQANWSWRLPWPVEALIEQEEPVERAAFLHAVTRAARR